uniref:CWF21 domain-containing protein n=1 Tax=Aegilops tauschii TaxID=37682 RepID=M8C1G7_AEGTA
MYNGIGLQTARGSGTNGHVQTNKFFIQPRTGGPPPKAHSHDDGAAGMRKLNKEILEHDRRRQVELRLVELRDTLEELGYTEGEIEERVEEARKEAELQTAAPRPFMGVVSSVGRLGMLSDKKKMILRLTMMMRIGKAKHEEIKGKKHMKKSFLDGDVDSEIVHKKATM